ncbi:MAG: threonine dehydratase [Solirubrobacteraceae bacterium]|jgi:threonine dehydratase|nr:threonine dehydratase [Solirubrobacteraceae bacterium]
MARTLERPEHDWLGLEAVHAARARIQDLVRHTPVLTSRSLGEQCGGTVLLKAENLQRTGSFKLRGALSRLADPRAARGVVAGSAGNHAQSLAYAARARGVPCEVFMPADAAVAKVAAVRGFGGSVTLGGESVDECVALARERAEECGALFVHPFDDPEIVAGQGTLGLELLEDAPEMATIVVPVGGGGLISGIAGVVKELRPDVRIVGVQVEACAPYPESLRSGAGIEFKALPTIADGIAIKRPGELTLALVRRFVDDMVTVADDDVAEAMVILLERAKLVVEGAGAVGVAALLSGKVKPAEHGATVVVLSGGNVDAGLLAAVARRHETAVGRRLRLFTRISDRPGGLAGLLALVAEAGGNLVTVDHVREAVPLHVRQTGVHLVLETRGAEHAEQIVTALAGAGYEVERQSQEHAG